MLILLSWKGTIPSPLGLQEYSRRFAGAVMALTQGIADETSADGHTRPR
jgi:hypothetical protein